MVVFVGYKMYRKAKRQTTTTQQPVMKKPKLTSKCYFNISVPSMLLSVNRDNRSYIVLCISVNVDDDDEESTLQTRLNSLREKHPDYSDFKLRVWAKLLVII